MALNSEQTMLAATIPPGSKVLWVASTGGHLEQLVRIAEGLDDDKSSLWVTFESQQSRSLLSERNVHFVDYVSPRDVRGAINAARKVRPMIVNGDFDFCVSTGAGLAAFVLPMARAHGIQTLYVESVSRTQGPSLTGRLMRIAPGVSTFTQHREWSTRKWRYLGSLLETWDVRQQDKRNDSIKILVTLGTIKPYRFDRAVDAVLKMIEPNDEVVWQLGATARTSLPGMVHTEIRATELMQIAKSSDVVITHSGVGSILSLLDAGIAPVLAVRERASGEHVDDHQKQIADAMVGRGLACRLDLDTPDRGVLLEAQRLVVEKRNDQG
ncbi:glycosyltransferase [Rhodococcus sp. NPDC127530]|uniref:glycosyltransferase n=1 Tax=unclassified Rhodococcus (in: high G+C Gram-positive bacteria) TaxID=192944 RepID=UPI0036389A8D